MKKLSIFMFPVILIMIGIVFFGLVNTVQADSTQVLGGGGATIAVLKINGDWAVFPIGAIASGDLTTGATAYAGYPAIKTGTAILFDLQTNIPAGSTIESAVIRFVGKDIGLGPLEYGGSGTKAYISAGLNPNAVIPTDLASYQAIRGTDVGGSGNSNISTNKVSFDDKTLTNGGAIETGDIKTMIQEVVDKGETSHILIFLDDHLGRSSQDKIYNFYEEGHGLESPIITIDYSVPSLSSDSSLSALDISQGTLTPAFATGTKSYTASVANDKTSLNVTSATTDDGATIKVNGTTVTSGDATSVDLAVGSNTINVVVTAEDSSTSTYTITVTRAASSDFSLSALAISQGTLTPTFATGTKSYTASVANDITSLNVTPTTTDDGATIKVNGTTVTSENATSVDLVVGDNTINVVVTAEDDSTTTYTITVTRAASSDSLTQTIDDPTAYIDSWKAEEYQNINSSCSRRLKLTIKGKHFDKDAVVKIGGKKAFSVNRKSSQEIVAKFCLTKLLNIETDLKRSITVTNPDTDKKKAKKKINLAKYLPIQ